MNAWISKAEKGRPTIQAGRATVYVRRRRLSAEWHFGARHSAVVSLSVRGIEESLIAHACIPFLFSVWFAVSGAHDYGAERELSLRFFDKGVWWNVWVNPDLWRSTDPHWRRGVWRPVDTLIGKEQYTRQVVSEGETVVAMPEGVYRAAYIESLDTWKRPRWPSRRTAHRYSFEMVDPIPEPGKGTEVYNLEDTALESTTLNADSLEDAIQQVRESEMRWRRQYGGKNWKPAAS